ncbi:hypothetical protein CFK41_00770 [Brachybacterium ginsengisoli]|uniref:Phosphatidic acid phosphatase type 2/haloperoxidase domain-containing protein n=1 Tax=Brachybacterium ginsengisoli TaxID=1331682 RepID=A0A291GTG5_9MICO|nr:phosphatase PAP2 family protein [Brachybacterium ginsengisoli]ATG53470.1 hypothetical protein CFK41_00770 [Brachybacterium ginsengisoli]
MHRGPSSSRFGVALLRPLLWAVVAALLAVAFAWSMQSLPQIRTADLSLVLAARRASGPVGDALALGIDIVFGPRAAVALVALVALVHGLARRSTTAGLRLALIVAVPWATAALLKAIVARPRPDLTLLPPGPVDVPGSFSFPSGHPAVAAALCCAILLTLRPGRSRAAATVLAAVVVGLTAWSRVALGVHHPSDVLASAVLVPVLARQARAVLDLVLPIPREQAEHHRRRRPPTIPPDTDRRTAEVPRPS